MNRTILIVEDNSEIANLIQIHLSDNHYNHQTANDGEQALKLFAHNHFDLVILDLMLPVIDGLEVCKRLRQSNPLIPIIMLTSKSSELDRVLGLEVGADDYLTKPFSFPELLARIKALFRRTDAYQSPANETSHRLKCGSLTIDIQKHEVKKDGTTIELTAKEFDLLYFFASHPGRVYSRLELLDKVWGYSYEGYEHTVNSHINRLRAKIEPEPDQPNIILTVWGVGYKFNEQTS